MKKINTTFVLWTIIILSIVTGAASIYLTSPGTLEMGENISQINMDVNLLNCTGDINTTGKVCDTTGCIVADTIVSNCSTSASCANIIYSGTTASLNILGVNSATTGLSAGSINATTIYADTYYGGDGGATTGSWDCDSTNCNITTSATNLRFQNSNANYYLDDLANTDYVGVDSNGKLIDVGTPSVADDNDFETDGTTLYINETYNTIAFNNSVKLNLTGSQLHIGSVAGAASESYYFETSGDNFRLYAPHAFGRNQGLWKISDYHDTANIRGMIMYFSGANYTDNSDVTDVASIVYNGAFSSTNPGDMEFKLYSGDEFRFDSKTLTDCTSACSDTCWAAKNDQIVCSTEKYDENGDVVDVCLVWGMPNNRASGGIQGRTVISCLFEEKQRVDLLEKRITTLEDKLHN